MVLRSDQGPEGRTGLYSSPRPTAAWTVIRASERLGAAMALLTLSPALALAGAILAVTSRASPIIAHERVGQHGRTLWVPKLRTMRGECAPGPTSLVEQLPENSAVVPLLKSESDPRILGSFARFCRRYSIDELPQLLLVATGSMSLVGPRPLTRAELLTQYGSHAGEILRARPGLSGLWQTSGRNRLTYAERLQMDLTLVRNYTPALYVRILALTPRAVLRGDGAC